MSIYEVLKVIQEHPKGIWIREIARKAGVSPATVCNYLYGYKNKKGEFVMPKIRKYVEIQRFGNNSVTLIKLKKT